jgi:Tol biopolymer transport system component
MTLDGAMLAYRSTDPERPGLYAISTAASGLVITRSGAIYHSGAISNSGTISNSGAISNSIAISDSGAISDSIVIGDSGIITITTDPEAQYPTWSPEGTQVAYATYDSEQEDWFIYIVDLTSQEPPRLIRQGRWPSWGIGGLLAFVGCSGENRCGIHVYDPLTQGLNRLTASGQDKAPTWSPNGDALVYMSDVGGLSSNLYAVNLDGYVWQITKNISTDIAPVWSPDGEYTAYVTNHRVDWMIYRTPLRGDYMQKERLTLLGVESAEWTRFRLAWVEPIIQLADLP